MQTQENTKLPLTTGQIARYCHVTHRGVLKWVESGKLKAYRTPGKHSRVHEEDFLKFLNTYGMPVPKELQAVSHKKKILIVDDDHGMVHSLRRALMMDNRYAIEVAYDGFQAGRKFSDFKPDFIILDICMPGLDGYQVCEYIRHSDENKHVKILVITAMSEPQEIKKMMDLGADDFLRKPFNNEVLRQKIRDMMGEKKP